jgi:hypothetical protein
MVCAVVLSLLKGNAVCIYAMCITVLPRETVVSRWSRVLAVLCIQRLCVSCNVISECSCMCTSLHLFGQEYEVTCACGPEPVALCGHRLRLCCNAVCLCACAYMVCAAVLFLMKGKFFPSACCYNRALHWTQ